MSVQRLCSTVKNVTKEFIINGTYCFGAQVVAEKDDWSEDKPYANGNADTPAEIQAPLWKLIVSIVYASVQ